MDMSKRQAALFFFGATGIFLAVFIALTIHSHTRFGALTRAEAIDEEVLEGKDVWHRKNCVNCHTLLGEGAYFAPDLTKITEHRGEAYLTQFLADPARFYDEEESGRLMTDPELDEGETAAVIAFLDWIAGIENQGWPPRPILVSGSALAGTFDRGVRRPAAASEDPVELGEALFNSTPPGCFTCHSTAPDVTLAGPSVARMASRAAERIEAPGYEGSATTPAEYVRESILRPSAFVVPGDIYSADGRSIMPANYGETLTDGEVDHLVAYLTSLR